MFHVLNLNSKRKIIIFIGTLHVIFGIICWAAAALYVLFIFLPIIISFMPSAANAITNLYQAMDLYELWEIQTTMTVMTLGAGLLIIVAPLIIGGTVFYLFGLGLRRLKTWARLITGLFNLFLSILFFITPNNRPIFIYLTAVLFLIISMFLLWPMQKGNDSK